MGFLTERERQIMEMLKQCKTVREIGKYFKVSDASISNSISNIKMKVKNLEEDIEFLKEIEFLEVSELEFISKDRDPKALSKKQ